jgi:transposase
MGIETDRGLLVGALLAAGYQVCAVTPQVVSRYRGRHSSSRAKSDRGDARVLADLVRTDATTTGRSPATACWPRRSRCWPGLIRA